MSDGAGTKESRTWWPFAIPAVVAVVAISLTFATESTSDKHATLSCPKTLQTSTERPAIPAVSGRVKTHGRLAPVRRPTAVIICAYGGSGHGAQPAAVRLTGHKKLTGAYDSLVDTVAYVPRKTVTRKPCPQQIANEDDGYYLLGLTYVNGFEWIDASQNQCALIPTTNGSVDSNAYLAAALSSAYRQGSWPPRSNPAKGCPGTGLGRVGQEKAMVPSGVTSVDLCTLVDSKTVADRHDDPAAAKPLIDALNALPTKPMIPTGCFGWYSSGDHNTAYELVFHYSAGADVEVAIPNSKDCSPVIGNGSLQSSSAAPVLPLVKQLLG